MLSLNLKGEKEKKYSIQLNSSKDLDKKPTKNLLKKKRRRPKRHQIQKKERLINPIPH
jgi:hypothetical protein